MQGKSCFQVAEYACNCVCSFQVKCFKVAEYAYNYVFMLRKVFKSFGKRISLRVYAMENCFKVVKWAYLYVFMSWKLV